MSDINYFSDIGYTDFVQVLLSDSDTIWYQLIAIYAVVELTHHDPVRLLFTMFGKEKKFIGRYMNFDCFNNSLQFIQLKAVLLNKL